MFLLPLRDIARESDIGIRDLVGPELRGSLGLAVEGFDPHGDELVLCRDLHISVIRGPFDGHIRLEAPTWVFLTALAGEARIRGPYPSASDGDLSIDGETFLFLAPGATARLVVGEASAVEVVAAPPTSGGAVCLSGPAPDELGGVVWVIRQGEIEPALGPRDKVKIVEPKLWRPPAKPGDWKAGCEIRCASMGFGVFRKGAPESTHSHQRTWEMYQVLDGTLELSLRRHRLGPWEAVAVESGQALLLPPGTGHIVHRDSVHVTAVIQSPPAISDRETVSYSPSNPSLELPFDD